MVDDDFADIRAALEADWMCNAETSFIQRLLAAIDERDKRIAELEANGVDHCDSCSCNYDPTVTR